MADNLAIKRHTGLDKAIGPVIAAARDRRSKLRLDSGAWEATRLAEVVAAFEGAGQEGDGQTAYQAEAAGNLENHQI